MLVQGFHYVRIAPKYLWLVEHFRTREVELEHDLVDVLEVVDGQGAEAPPLAALCVDLHHDVLSLEAVLVDHTFDRLEVPGFCHQFLLLNASVIENVRVVVGMAFWRRVVGAVVLVVRHREPRRQRTTQIIFFLDSYIYKSLNIVHLVNTEWITTITFSTQAFKLAVCILSLVVLTT